MMQEEVRYYQPSSFEELNEILPRLTEKSVILAGGTDLLITVRDKHPDIDCWLSLWSLKELCKIEVEDSYLKIGAMVTHNQAANHPLIKQYFQALSMACSRVGSQQVRNKGTLAGSIANASPAGDIMPCMYLFDAEIELLSSQGKRRIKAKEYLADERRRKREIREVITVLYLPIDEKKKSCFVKLGSRQEVTIAQISMCVSWKETKKGREEITSYIGAIDRSPVEFLGCEWLCGKEAMEKSGDEASKILREQIKKVRLNRKRESKMKFTQEEKLYKERAAKGVIFDILELMEA